MTKDHSNPSGDFFSVEIPSFLGRGGGTVIFTSEKVKYDGKTFALKDIQSVSYSSLSSTLNFIPTDQIYEFTLKTKKDKISITMETRLKIGDEHLQEQYEKLVSLSKQLIEPLIINRYLKMVFEEGYTLDIHGVRISQKGFKAGGHFTAWTEGFFLPNFERGNIIILWKDPNGRPKKSLGIPITWDNAPLLPDLFQACASLVRELRRRETGKRGEMPGQELPEQDLPGQELREGAYQVLGIEPGASWEEVEAAYRAQAKLYHPDRVAGLAPEFVQLAEEKMKAINTAFEELKSRFGKT